MACLAFRANVMHLPDSYGITCYCQTMQEAIAWIADWPDIIEAHITRVILETPPPETDKALD